ncbi:hypothetical protein [Paradevosia shaoguanensis]|uniref:Uncharacterized protein n=1 Tax=Paradevosia shaoguanensis TaxID=1335043 RepID=A0AA41UDS7_9HYPH|nr:hypothetical protein [Paradevosia shaoguanensis]MCF1743196.1 hypothetical protein [Paradevosia shaoguanensis]MCI0127679.1 hypothetical protein [Paradevosia shaoguanensis]QMV01467.1 hypothetical protein GHV40_08245 [Devosia sp. D6-9]
MTARIAPAPVSMSTIGPDERQQRRQPQPQPDDNAQQEATRRFHALRKKAKALAAAVDTDESLPASTLFAVTLFANGMRQSGQQIDLPLRRDQWAPPDSGLRLRDKTI